MRIPVTVACVLAGIFGLACAFALSQGGGRASAAGPGDITIGTNALNAGKIDVPINTSGSATDPYNGANVTLTWDTTKLSFASVDTTGTTLAAAGTPLCLPAAYSGAGGTGRLDSCSVTGSPSITAAGLLMTFHLNVVAAGCANLHLVTRVEDPSFTFSTFLFDAVSGNPQTNTLGSDVGVDTATGASCGPTSTPTNTVAATNTPTITATATPTSTATPTLTPVSGAPDVAVGLVANPTAANSGAPVTYTVSLANLGNVAAQNVSLTFTLPAGGVLLGVGPCPTYVRPSFICSIGTLAPNNGVPGGPDEATITFSARLPYSTSTLPYLAQAVVSASNEPLGNQGNNTASAAVAISGCPDLNGDNAVNALDLNILTASAYLSTGQPGFNPLADLNGDGTVDGLDLNAMAKKFGQFCVGLDSDHDGISNYDEINLYHTCPGLQPEFQTLPQCHVGGSLSNPLIADSSDTDSDGLPDGIEAFTYHSDPLNPDTDGDFYSDGQEAAIGKSPTIYCAIMAADITMDGAVNALDLNRLAKAFGSQVGQPNYDKRADINRDGANNGLDLNVLAGTFSHFISECP